AGAEVGPRAGDGAPPLGAAAQLYGSLQLELADQRRTATGERGVLGDAGDQDVAFRGTLEELAHERGRDAPVGHQVAVDEHEAAGLRLLHTPLDGLPFPPVAQQVGVDARLRIEPEAEGGER